MFLFPSIPYIDYFILSKYCQQLVQDNQCADRVHDDVIKCKHFPRYWPFVRGIPGEFPTQRPVTRSFDFFFDLRLNKRLSKQSWGWWFETLSRPLRRHRNETTIGHPYPWTFFTDIRLKRVSIKHLCMKFTIAEMFAADCPCHVWCRELTTFYLYISTAFGNLVLIDNWSIGLA